MKSLRILCAISIIIVSANNSYAEFPPLNSGNCNARPPELNVDTGKLEMDVTNFEMDAGI